MESDILDTGLLAVCAECAGRVGFDPVLAWALGALVLVLSRVAAALFASRRRLLPEVSRGDS